MLKSRVVIAALLLAGALPLLFYGTPWMWQGVTFIIALLAAWEWARLAGLASSAARVYVGLTGVLLVAGGWLLADNIEASQAVFGWMCLFWVAIAPLSILAQWQWRSAIFGGVGMMIIFAAWHAAAILFATDLYTLLAVFILVWTADIAAFAIGKLFGKTPLAPTVSPGKTWEGFFGGGGVVLVIVYFVGPLLFFAPPRLWLLLAAFALVSLSVLGDLFESAAKRRCGVKDSGHLLGGHGGVLDRLDALLPALPFAALMSPWLV